MAYRHWTLEDIPWDAFDPARVDANQLKIAKAAAMVEYNAGDYVTYLENVFADDPAFLDAARAWGVEEVQHGAALGRWAHLADPAFDFDARFVRFKQGFRLNLETDRSIRGSRAGELVARCMVEVGTSSYYSALADAATEPVFQVICRRIATDELRHYKLFYDHLKRWLAADGLNRFQRLRVALGRMAETEDDELSYAFYAANETGEPYDRERCNKEYFSRAIQYYRRPHVDRGLAMIFKACGLKPHSALFNTAAFAARFMLERRQRQLSRLAA